MMRRNLHIAAVTVVLLSMGQPPAVPAATNVAPGYDGATLIAGLFFGAGPVAELFPEYYRNPSTPLSVEDRGVLAERIATAHPEFLGEFAAAMQSGDHVLIAERLRHAWPVVSESARVALAHRDTGPPLTDPDKNIVVPVNVLSVVNVLVVANVIHIAQIYNEIVVADEFFVWAREQFPSPDSGDLQYDYLVSLIAERLAAA